jgi:hypothetical protein
MEAHGTMDTTESNKQDTIPGHEVAELLRRAGRGEVKIVAVGRSWNLVYAGNVTLVIGDYVVVIFNDCDELDYVDSATAPDGRRGELEAWWESHTEPVSLLTEVERMQVVDALRCAPVAQQ